jgi:hypothetical protein
VRNGIRENRLLLLLAVSLPPDKAFMHVLCLHCEHCLSNRGFKDHFVHVTPVGFASFTLSLFNQQSVLLLSLHL